VGGGQVVDLGAPLLERPLVLLDAAAQLAELFQVPGGALLQLAARLLLVVEPALEAADQTPVGGRGVPQP